MLFTLIGNLTVAKPICFVTIFYVNFWAYILMGYIFCMFYQPKYNDNDGFHFPNGTESGLDAINYTQLFSARPPRDSFSDKNFGPAFSSAINISKSVKLFPFCNNVTWCSFLAVFLHFCPFYCRWVGREGNNIKCISSFDRCNLLAQRERDWNWNVKHSFGNSFKFNSFVYTIQIWILVSMWIWLSSHVESYVKGGGFRDLQKIESFFIALEFELWMKT